MKYDTWVKWEQKLWATESLNIVIAEVNEHIYTILTQTQYACMKRTFNVCVLVSSNS